MALHAEVAAYQRCTQCSEPWMSPVVLRGVSQR